MKRTISLILLVGYISSLFCFVAPWVHFSINQEYIKTHLCESLTNPDLKDCDGYCYLKKQVKQHHQEHSGEHSEAVVMNNMPVFLFYAPLSDYSSFNVYTTRDYMLRDEYFKGLTAQEPLSPPPKG